MRIGPYEVKARLGEGGAGVVFAARGPAGDDVAVKLLRAATPDSLARFERESRLQGQLGDVTGFVPVLEVGRTPQGPYLVMPLLQGGTLRHHLGRGPLPLDATIDLVLQLGDALGRAHEKGIVHRDMKPENVLFDARGRAFIADLGLAKHFTDETPGASRSLSLSRAGSFRGTAGYMAPEQALDARSAGPRADVFSLGAILYECLSGHPAFQGENPVEVLTKVDECDYEEPAGPPWLVAIVERALERRPEDRFPDGASFARAVREGPAPAKRIAPGFPWKVFAGVASSLVLAVIFIPFGPSSTPVSKSKPRPKEMHEVAPPKKEPPKPEVSETIATLRDGVERGVPDCMVDLGLAYLEGKDVPRDDKEAVRLFRLAAEKGSGRGMNCLGTSFAMGRGVAPDGSLALDWFKKSAEAGEPEGMTNLGAILYNGQGVAKDEKAAVEWFRKASALGHARGTMCLAMAHGEGRGVPLDLPEAARLFRMSAQAGDAQAMTKLAEMLLDGLGVPKDETESVRWLKKAVDEGAPDAFHDLGVLLLTGRAVPKDEVEAVALFRRGVAVGNIRCVHDMGVVSLEGRGTKKDEVAALAWFKKAADAGDGEGMKSLAYMHENGLGGAEKDRAEAVRLYMEAASRNTPGAVEALKRLGAE